MSVQLLETIPQHSARFNTGMMAGGLIVAMIAVIVVSIFNSNRPPPEARWFGMEIEPLTPGLRSALRLTPDQPGVFVSDVVGIAAESGIKEGDVIINVNDRVIEGIDSFLAAKDAAGTDLAKIVVTRQGQVLSFSMYSVKTVWGTPPTTM